MPTTNMTRAQQFLKLLRERYDLYGADDPIYYDTYNGNNKRSLASLERQGLVKVWVDADDPARTWAAALPKDQT